jgi:hypothetical protein
MLYRPAQIAMAGLVVWFAIWLLLPVDIRLPMRPNTIGFIALGYSCFLGGCLWAQQSPDHTQSHGMIVANPWQQPLQKKLFWISFFIGLGSFGLRLFDRIVIRGLDYTANVNEIRETLASTDFSAASVISSIFLPLCFLPFILILASRWERGHGPKLTIAVFLSVLPMLENLAQASRSVMLLTVMMLFFAACLLKNGGRVISRRTVLPLFAGVFLIVLLSSAIFSGRLEAGGRSVEDSVFSSVYAEAFRPTRLASDALSSENPVVRGVTEATLPLGMYYVHGFYEYDMSLNRPDNQLFAYGSYIFFPYSRVLALIFGSENIRGLNDERIIYRIGTFTSFFGPLWVDFGYFQFPLLVFLGYAAQRMAALVKNGLVNVVPLYLLFIVAIFYIPVYNFLTNGFGFFTFNGYLLFWLFSSFGNAAPATANETTERGLT